MGIRTELTLRLPNSPGAAASVCQDLSGARVNILGLMLNPSGHLHLLVDNPVRAAGVLRDAHHQIATRDVLFVSVAKGPGGLAPVLTIVEQAGINVDYIYSAAGETTATTGVVLGVEDPQRVAALAGI